MRRIRSLLDVAGLPCVAVDSAFLKRPALEPVPWDAFRRSLEVAHALGATFLRIFSGLRGQPAPTADWLDETLRRAVGEAFGSGVTVALELEQDCAVGSRAEAAAALVEGLALVWDPGNEAMLARVTPDAEGHAAVAAAIGHVHVKDATVEGSWVAPGAGLVDWEGELRRLEGGGYDGCLSLETHWEAQSGGREAATLTSLEALRVYAERAGVTLA